MDAVGVLAKVAVVCIVVVEWRKVTIDGGEPSYDCILSCAANGVSLMKVFSDVVEPSPN